MNDRDAESDDDLWDEFPDYLADPDAINKPWLICPPAKPRWRLPADFLSGSGMP